LLLIPHGRETRLASPADPTFAAGLTPPFTPHPHPAPRGSPPPKPPRPPPPPRPIRLHRSLRQSPPRHSPRIPHRRLGSPRPALATSPPATQDIETCTPPHRCRLERNRLAPPR